MIRRQERERERPRENDPVEDGLGAAILLLGLAAAAQAYGNQSSSARQRPRQETRSRRDFVWARVDHPEAADLNLRDGPGFQYPPIAIMSDGTRGLKVFGCDAYDGERAWCYLQLGRYRGWASSKYLATDE